MNKLFFGDNLSVLRNQVKDQSVDLIYLDPPFNSNANYNVLFKEGGALSEAQVEAFRDTWSWGDQAAVAFDEAARMGGDLAPLLRSLRGWLGDSAMMAYLAMMAVRLVELRRVLRPSGSIYLHCDPVASHYLKIILDSIFGHERFANEIIWQRSTGKSLMSKRLPNNHDVLLNYEGGAGRTWNSDAMFEPYDEDNLPETVASKYVHYEDDGRRYRLDSLINPNPNRPNLTYEFMGVTRVWRWTQERMKAARDKGLIVQSGPGRVPQLKRYLAEQRGRPLGDVWTDIPPLNSQARERLGYPTQKPVKLLDRVIRAASNPGDIVLDPFCGCGTSIEAAEILGRGWVGIDVTHYAITLIEQRLSKSHPLAKYEVAGRPSDLAGARDLARRDKHQFQWWAAWLLGVQSYVAKKGADRGIDGNIYFANGPYGYGRIIVSVKGGENVSPVMVRELSGVVQRENASMGILVTLVDPTRAMLADAAGAGFVEQSAHGRLPRVQIATIADLLDGRLPKMPPLPRPPETAHRSGAARNRDQLELLLPLPGDGPTEAEIIVDPRFMRLGSR